MKAEVVKVTPEIASEWLELNYERQRTIKQRKLKQYKEDMLNGNWDDTKVVIFAVNDLTGKKHLIDGQHFLQATKETNTVNTCVVTTHHYKDDLAIARAYGKIDIGTNRSVKDRLQARLPEITTGDLTISDIRYLGTGLQSLELGFARSKANRLDDDRLIEAINYYYGEAELYFRDLIPAANPIYKPAYLKRAHIIALSLVLLKQQPKKGLEFVEGFITGNNLYSGDPRKLLMQHIVETNLSRGSRVSNSQLIPTRVSAKMYANCWNAFYEERTLKWLRTPSAQFQIVLTDIDLGIAFPWNDK